LLAACSFYLTKHTLLLQDPITNCEAINRVEVAVWCGRGSRGYKPRWCVGPGLISIAAAKAACSFFGPFGLAICPVIVGLAFSYDTMQRHITHTGRIKNNKLIHI